MLNQNKSIWPVTLLKSAIVVLSALVIYMVIDFYGESEIEAAVERAGAVHAQQIDLELESLKNSADIVASLIFDEKTCEALHRAQSQMRFEDARKALLSRYRPIFDTLQRHALKHLQFHLPDGRSFLRVHAPSKYGDSLLSIRPSIRIITKEHKPLFGYEIGRYLGAYRAIYPLNCHHRYVGSAELSFTFDAMKRALEEVAKGERHYYLLLELDKIKRSGEAKLLHAFRRCAIDGRFAIDEKSIDNCKIFKQSGYRTDLLPYRPFSTVLHVDREVPRIVSFHPLKDIGQEACGYYVVVQKDNGVIEHISSSMHLAKIALILAAAVALILIWMLHFYRKRAVAASMDELTGIYNRRGCMERLGNGDRRYALLFIDIDHFKEINDTYGHEAGDRVLKEVARVIASHIRKDDILCRYGGEEFLLFVANASEEQARVIAEKLRKHIQIHEFEGIGKVTVSIGIAIRERNESIGSLINRADKNLYVAKKSGRNMVITDSTKEENEV